MNRLEKSKQVRRKILSYIKRNPGSHFTQIRKRLELSSGCFARQILKIEKDEKIFSIYDGSRKMFYPISMKDENIPNPMTTTQEKVYDLIKQYPGLSYEDIVKKEGKTRLTFVYHIGKLMKMNLVRREREKGKHHFYVVEREK